LLGQRRDHGKIPDHSGNKSLKTAYGIRGLSL
jgi:hypothetical protein